VGSDGLGIVDGRPRGPGGSESRDDGRVADWRGWGLRGMSPSPPVET
jgi:hypothetical protein